MTEIESSRRIARMAEWLNARVPQRLKAKIAPRRRQLRDTRLTLRMRRAEARCRPSFLIIGAQKAGTTSLFRYLARHPQIVAPIAKEIRYFDWYWSRPLDWYWAHFPLQSEMGPAGITGEASPDYLGHPAAAERLAGVLPQAKLIVLLRDPIGRAVSHYHHALRGGWESRSIEEAFLCDESLQSPELDALEHRGPAAFAHNYMARGYYADQLEWWFKRFDRSQFLVLQSETLFSNPNEVYEQALNFLALPSFQLREMEPYNAGRYRRYLSDELLQTLAAHYSEPNQRLYELLDTDFGWERFWQDGNGA